MSARHRHPTLRTIRRAVDVLAQLKGEALAALAEAIIERLDATVDDDAEEEFGGACEVEDRAPPGWYGRGENDDDEEGADDEPDDDAEAGHEGCCDAGDDDPASSRPAFGVEGVVSIGDLEDSEPTGDDEPGEDMEGEFVARNGETDLSTIGAWFVTGPVECSEVRL